MKAGAVWLDRQIACGKVQCVIFSARRAPRDIDRLRESSTRSAELAAVDPGVDARGREGRQPGLIPGVPEVAVHCVGRTRGQRDGAGRGADGVLET